MFSAPLNEALCCPPRASYLPQRLCVCITQPCSAHRNARLNAVGGGRQGSMQCLFVSARAANSWCLAHSGSTLLETPRDTNQPRAIFASTPSGCWRPSGTLRVASAREGAAACAKRSWFLPWWPCLGRTLSERWHCACWAPAPARFQATRAGSLRCPISPSSPPCRTARARVDDGPTRLQLFTGAEAQHVCIVGVTPSSVYEARASVSAATPAAVDLSMVISTSSRGQGGSPASAAGRRALLDTEKLVFGTDEQGAVACDKVHGQCATADLAEVARFGTGGACDAWLRVSARPRGPAANADGGRRLIAVAIAVDSLVLGLPSTAGSMVAFLVGALVLAFGVGIPLAMWAKGPCGDGTLAFGGKSE